MIPTIGRIVHYTLTADDAAAVNRRREDAAEFQRSLTVQSARGDRGRSGHVLHTGNPASEGDAFPATIVRTFGETTVNLQVILDGNDTYWATSRSEGDGRPGTWSWPPRV